MLCGYSVADTQSQSPKMNPFRVHFIGIAATKHNSTCVMDETGQIVNLFSSLQARGAGMLEIWELLGKMNRAVILMEKGYRPFAERAERAGIIVLQASRLAVNAEYADVGGSAKEITASMFEAFKDMFPERFPQDLEFMRCVLMSEFIRRMYMDEHYCIRR